MSNLSSWFGLVDARISASELCVVYSTIEMSVLCGSNQPLFWDIMRKRGKVPRIRVISFRKTSLSILKTHLTWRLRSCISTFKIVPIIVSQFQLILTKMIIDEAYFHKKSIYLSDENWLQHFNLSHFRYTKIICNYCAFKKLVKIG